MDPSDDQTRIVVVELPSALSGLAVRYEILAEVGRGGMGIVYKARDRQTADIVAIKVLHPAIASAPGLIDRFTNELLLARRITHKSVCRVHDLNEFAGTAVISMEFVDGESLREIMRRPEGISIRHGLKIIRQVLAGLGEAHHQGIVHRDLKPANILVTADGGVKIVDFGVARSVDSEETSVGKIIGTPAYMSPEQAEGRQPDARSDIYSLGLVMYELFCGRPAFTADSAFALIARQTGDTPTPPRDLEPDLPRRIELAILKCLEKKPARRYQSIAELDAALSAEPASRIASSAPDETPLPPHLTQWRRSDVLLTAAAAAGVLAFLAVFDRTSLAPRSQLTFDRIYAQRIVQEHLQRLGSPASRLGSVHVDWDSVTYVYLAKGNGAAAARELANNPVPYWEWHAVLENGGSVALNNRGELLSYSRGTPAAAKGPPRQDARAIAEKTVLDLWRRPVAGLDLERTTAGGSLNSFAWLNPQAPYGLVERYSVTVDPTGISNAFRTFYPPPGFKTNEIRWSNTTTLAIALLLPILGLLHRRRINATANWRIALSVSVFLATGTCAFYLWNLSTVGDYLAVSLGLALIGGFAWLLSSMAVEVQMRRMHPARLHTLVRLLGSRAATEPCGLAILRGTLIGLALLGIDAAVSWLALARFGGYLDWRWHIYVLGRALNGSQWPGALVLAAAWLQALGIGLVIAFVVSASERLVAAPWLRWSICVVLLAASGVHLSMAAVQPFYWALIVLLVDYAVLVLVFTKFDLLTLLAAIFTFAFCLANYALFIMRQQIGTAGPAVAFVVWGLLVAFAVTILLQSTLRVAYRRMAASFE